MLSTSVGKFTHGCAYSLPKTIAEPFFARGCMHEMRFLGFQMKLGEI